MPGYSDFAVCYDALTFNVDYRGRAEALDRAVMRHMGSRGILLDLACGTGSMSEAMAAMGYDVIGVDISEDMLGVALEKKAASGLPIQYLCQDMRELDMFGTVGVTVCTLDSLNHLGSREDIMEVFRRVSLFTDPGGLFLFDMNTPYKHREILGSNTFVYDREDIYCVWQNFPDENSPDSRVDIVLDFFVPQADGSYKRLCDEVSETAYDESEIIKMLECSGFELLEILDGDSFEKPCPTSQRLLYIGKKLQIRGIENG